MNVHITNMDLLYTTGSYIQCLVITYNEKNLKKNRYVAESLCCVPEASATLYISYTSIILMVKEKKKSPQPQQSLFPRVDVWMPEAVITVSWGCEAGRLGRGVSPWTTVLPQGQGASDQKPRKPGKDILRLHKSEPVSCPGSSHRAPLLFL